jgi:hypothetical protein
LSWKSVELQVALPRVQDAGKEQDLMSKQNQRFQETLNQTQLQEQIRQRNQVNKFEKLKGMDLKDEEKDGQQNPTHKNEHEMNQEELEEKLQHPYLGSNIDFSG